MAYSQQSSRITDLLMQASSNHSTGRQGHRRGGDIEEGTTKAWAEHRCSGRERCEHSACRETQRRVSKFFLLLSYIHLLNSMVSYPILSLLANSSSWPQSSSTVWVVSSSRTLLLLLLPRHPRLPPRPLAGMLNRTWRTCRARVGRRFSTWTHSSGRHATECGSSSRNVPKTLRWERHLLIVPLFPWTILVMYTNSDGQIVWIVCIGFGWVRLLCRRCSWGGHS